MAKFSIRFAVGSKNDLRSSTWIIFGSDGKSDIYLSPILITNDIKVSLHESGQYHLGFQHTSPFFLKNKSQLFYRYRNTWSRPKELIQGMTLAFRIFIATSELDFLTSDTSKSINWTSAAPINNAIEYLIILTSFGLPVTGWPGKNTGTSLVKQINLPNEKLWLVSREQFVPPKVTQMMDNIKTQIIEQPHLVNDTDRVRCLGLSTEPDGSKTFYEIKCSNV